MGGWWGDVLFRVKDATAAPGAGAGDGGEMEHAVRGVGEDNSGVSVGERKRES